MKIYLTRHGQTQWNIENRLQGWKDSPLTEKGIVDAKLLGNRLKDIDIDIIYSSSSGRAITTAKIIKEKKDIEIVMDEGLREMGVGDWHGMTLEEIKRNNPKEYYNYWYAPHLYIGTNGGEDFYQVQKRAVAAVNSIIHERKYENVLIISHGVTLKSIITYYQNKSMEKLWDPPILEGTSLSLIEVDGDNIKVPFCGDVSHLKDGPQKFINSIAIY